MKKNIIYGVALALAAGLSACDSYLDINDNPNTATENQLTPSNIFPGCEGAFMNIYGGTWHYMGAFQSWQFAQSAAVWQWGQISRGDVTNETGNSGYSNVYAKVLQNLRVVLNNSAKEEDWGTYLAATTLRAQSLQLIVDAFGDAPYSEALDIDNNKTPKWDTGEEVYKGILAELNDALAKPIIPNKGTCTSLMFNGGNEPASSWVKIANAVKLRLLMRISNVQDVRSELAALIAEDNFPTSDVKWSGIFANQQYKCNPFFGQFTDTGNHAPYCQMNIATQKVYEAGQDTRMNRYWLTQKDGKYVGWLSGTYPGNEFASSYNGNGACSNANLKYDDPIYLITVAEIEFFKAEYEARYGSASAAQEHYENAIKASFSQTAGLPEADAATVIEAWPYDQNNWAKCIGIQKWLHLTSVNGFEGWCELRRMKYPAFGSATGDDIIEHTKDATIDMDALVAGEIYTTPSWERDAQLPANTVIQRWIYPSNSSNNNPNTPKPVPITTPVFWAK